MKKVMTEKRNKLGTDYFILQEFLIQKKDELERIGFKLDIMLFIPREINISRADIYILVNEGINIALKNPLIKSQKIIYLSIIWSQESYIVKVNNSWQPFGKYLYLERIHGTKKKRTPLIRSIVKKYDGMIDIADESDLFSFWILLYGSSPKKADSFLILAQIPYNTNTKTFQKKPLKLKARSKLPKQKQKQK